MLPDYINNIKQILIGKGFSSQIHSAIILGSGLGDFTSRITGKISIPYREIPHMPAPSVEGHSGNLIFGFIDDKSVLAFSGRFHHYEGHSFRKTVLPVHLSAAFNVNTLIISNASGSINTKFKVGDLMVIDDIIRPFQIISPSPSSKFRYNLYPVADKARTIAVKIGLDVQRGSYLYVQGPNYETPAEIRAFRVLGADVVGMSTVPELMEASKLNIRTAAISLITNMASGVQKGKLSHDDVKKAAESRKEDFATLVCRLINEL